MGHLAANITVVMSIALSLAWIALARHPGQWHYEDAYAVVMFNVGLYSVDCQMGLATSVLSMAMPSNLKALGGKVATNGTWEWMQPMVARMCSVRLNPRWCQMWTMLQHSSRCLIFCIIVAILFLAIGAWFHYYYWNEKPSEGVRNWTIGGYFVAAISVTFGMAQYTAITSDFKVSGNEYTFGVAWAFAVMLVLFTWVPLIVIYSCSDPEMSENYEHEAAAARKRKDKDRHVDMHTPQQPQQWHGQAEGSLSYQQQCAAAALPQGEAASAQGGTWTAAPQYGSFTQQHVTPNDGRNMAGLTPAW